MKNKKFDYFRIIVILCFLMEFVCLGFCNSAKSLFVTPVSTSLGVLRSVYAVSDSVRYLTTAVTNVFFGVLVLKFGTKRMIAAGFVCLAAAMGIYTVAPNIVIFCIGSLFLGMGLALTTTTMIGSVMNKWCKKNKGAVMGGVLSASGVGGALATQVVSPIINLQGVTDAWRYAYLLFCLVVLVTGIFVVIFFKEEPPVAVAQAVDNKKKRDRMWQGIDFSTALKKPYFYTAVACIFLSGLVLQGISGVAAAHMRDVGLEHSYVATVLSVHLISLTLCKFFTGFIYDKAGFRFTYLICAVTGVAVMVLLACITNTFSGTVMAMIYGIFSALALTLETVMIPIYADELFGQKSYNKAIGIFAGVNTAGFAFSAPIINSCYDIFGNYKNGFLMFAVIMAAVTITMQFVISAAKRQKKAVEEK